MMMWLVGCAKSGMVRDDKDKQIVKRINTKVLKQVYDMKEYVFDFSKYPDMKDTYEEFVLKFTNDKILDYADAMQKIFNPIKNIDRTTHSKIYV